jgi:dethiobiotin synthetase
VSVLVVTGTDTGVGKTVTTAALACAARLAGLDVAVCKPVQTGAGASAATGEIGADGDDDLGEVGRLSGVTALHGGWRYPEALAPVAAATRAGLPLPTRDELLASVRAADAPGRLTIVVGAGGLLVQLGADGVTLRDLATDLSAPVLVVVSPGLGTLNHTALTLESLAAKGVPVAGLVIGAWPELPGPAEQDNRQALAQLAELRAVLPAGAAPLSIEGFQMLSTSVFDRNWIASLV